MNDIRNMRIESVSLTMADHGVLTFYVHLTTCSLCAGYGGYVIGKGCLGADNFEGSAKGLEAMMRIMDVVGVDTWEDLPNKYIRAIIPKFNEPITVIGNIMEDKWFDIKQFFEEDSK